VPPVFRSQAKIVRLNKFTCVDQVSDLDLTHSLPHTRRKEGNHGCYSWFARLEA
jgi:hypothetical protein